MLAYKVRSVQPLSNFHLFGKQILLNSMKFLYKFLLFTRSKKVCYK